MYNNITAKCVDFMKGGVKFFTLRPFQVNSLDDKNIVAEVFLVGGDQSKFLKSIYFCIGNIEIAPQKFIRKKILRFKKK